ncbi:MAG: cysteine desulfurase [Planctomycetes bacterium]|nr:cysteine desulfurase [Planctomycetota bacterium]
MSSPPIYLDHAATTQVSPAVRAAMLSALEAEYGTPSPRPPLGSRARQLVEVARQQVARSVGAARADVVFTSGGTEANNLAVLGLVRSAKGCPTPTGDAQVLVGPTEPPSVRAASEALAREGFVVERLRLGAGGELDVAAAAERIGPGTRLVAQMAVNNEFGTRYDLARLARAVAARGGPSTHLHVDAVQALGKHALDVTALFEAPGISGSLALSAHKIHGPKGVGALVFARGARRPAPLVFGGGQEGDLRPGTENVPGIVGFGRAAEEATRDIPRAFEALEAVRSAFESAVAAQLPAARVLVPYVPADGSGDSHNSPHILSLQVPGAPAEVWLHHLETLDVFASAGSACQAHSKDLSPALLALGLDDEAARHVLRFSFSAETTRVECEQAAEALARVAEQLAHL